MRQHREQPMKRRNPSGDTVWVARYTGPDGKRRSAGTFKRKGPCGDSERADCCASHAIEAAYAGGTRIPTVRRRETVGGFAEDWTDRFPRAERTDRTNQSRLNAVLDVELGDPDERQKLRDWPWREMKRRHVRELVEHMLVVQGRAVGGAQNILRTLATMTNDAIEDELIEGNVFAGFAIKANDRRARKKPKTRQVWTFEQMHTFAAAAGRGEAMVRMLSDCGLRIGEMLGLQRSQQDLKGGEFVVLGSAWNGALVESSETKQHDRRGPIPPSTLALLRAEPTRIDSPWLFPTWGSERDGKKGFDLPGGALWRYENFMRQVWEPAVTATGMACGPQEFRVSFNSQMLAAGVDRVDLADILGHSEDVNAERYTRALRRSGDKIREVVG